MKKKRYAIAPKNGCRSYITSGKWYEMTSSDDEMFWIKDDDGDSIGCIEIGCAHLHGGNWKIVTR